LPSANSSLVRIFGEIPCSLNDNISVTDLRFGLRIAAAIFIVIAVVHVVRLAVHLQLQIGGQPIPMWPSILAAIIFGFLGVWMWRLSNRGGGT